MRIIDHPLYGTWARMKSRCYNRNNVGYKDYGGRGINVCDEWRNSFSTFLRDMGEKPTPNHSIDRINNDGNYEPSNCRWATRLEQNKNRDMKRNKLTKRIEILEYVKYMLLEDNCDPERVEILHQEAILDLMVVFT